MAREHQRGARRRLHGPRRSRPFEFFAAPRGDINRPPAGSEVAGDFVQVFGWALFPAGTVSRVEVTVAGGPPQRARLGMARFDVPEHTDHSSAPISGFELMADVRALRGPVEIRAVAYSTDGRRVEIDPVKVDVVAGEDDDAVDDERAALLRERAARHARPRLTPSNGNVRMLAFSHQLPYGGASLWMFEVLRRFARRPGFECTVVTYQDGPLRQELEALGMAVHLADPYPVMTLERYEGSIAELMAWCAPQRFDVAFVNTLGSFHGADVAQRLGVPVVWGVHESFTLPLFWSTVFPPGHLHPYVRRRAERAFADADAIIFEAEATRRLFLPAAPAERLITLPYGIELDPLHAARASYDRAEVRAALGIGRDARVILCLGTIEPRKTQAVLAEAFATIADRHPDAVLALVGRTNAAWCADYVAGLEAFVERSGLAGRIRVEPVAANPLPWHVAADVHVCASDVESLPRSVLEAMAIGVPVVSTRVFGVADLIEDGVTGYLCDTRDAGGLAGALDRALSADAAERARVTEAAAKLVHERHEPSAYAEDLWRLFAALARDAAADPRAVLFGERGARRLSR